MYTYHKPDNLVDLLEGAVKKWPDNNLFGTKNSSATMDWMTYREIGRRVENLRGGLALAGIQKGDSVGIIANNRPEWAITAFASYGLGAVFIPMYEAELESTWKYIVTDAKIKILLVSKPAIYEKIKNLKNAIPTLEKIFIIESDDENSMAALEQAGEKNPVQSFHPDPYDVAGLVYTSGTTGEPKGVVLTHGNFTSNARGGGELFSSVQNENSRSISILPWAHSYGQTAELYNFIRTGGSIGFMESVATLASDLAICKPTFIIAVPRVFNKIYDGLWAKMNEEGGLPRKLFVSAVETARKKRELAESGQSSHLTNIRFALLDRLVFSKIRARFGGRLLGALTASATMNIDIAHFFFDIGIPIYDCYGLSETSPAVTMNCPAAYRLGSVGRAIEDVRIVIDTVSGDPVLGDGEIIVYGPNVMMGYHNKPEATKEVMTSDGGFRTGDRGRIDKDGYLFITGRIKEQYKLENGKYVFPAALEEDIRLIPGVANAMVFGDGKPYNICLLIPDLLVLEKYAAQKGLPTDRDTLLNNQDIRNMIVNKINDSLKGTYGGYEIPRKYFFMGDDFTLENGMLTQTMKLKRRVVVERYKDKISELYKK